MTLALVMIVRDEETCLGRCLDAARPYVDEIVIVDTGSTDGTPAIARSFGATVYNFTDPICFDEKGRLVDFAAARQYATDRASTDCCLWLDADDVLIGGEHVRDEARYLIDCDRQTRFAAYQYSPTDSHWRERLFRRDRCTWRGVIHEHLESIAGQLQLLESDFAHSFHVEHHPPAERTRDPHRNLRVYQFHLARGRRFDAREWLHAALELRDADPVQAQQLAKNGLTAPGSVYDQARLRRLLGELAEERDTDLGRAVAWDHYAGASLLFPAMAELWRALARLAHRRGDARAGAWARGALKMAEEVAITYSRHPGFIDALRAELAHYEASRG